MDKGRLTDATVLAALVGAYCLPAPYATLSSGTVRDLSASLSLALGEALPMVGPPVDFGLNLGPAWIWLQGLPLFFWQSITGVAVFVAVVASLKFPLLYLLGRVLRDAKLGLCFAAAAAMPGIAVYQWQVFFHPNWVEAAVVASLLCAVLGWRRRQVAVVHAAAALLGLAVQMDAAAIFYFPLVMLAYAAAGARGIRLLVHAAVGVGLVALYFAPIAFAPDPQYAKLDPLAGRLATAIGNWRPADALRVVVIACVDVPLAIGETYAAAAGVPLWAWAGALGAIGLVAAAGLAAGIAMDLRGLRWPIVALAIAWVIAWNAATGARAFTSFHLAYFILPLNAMLAGAGMYVALTSSSWPWRACGVGALLGVAACLAIASIGAWRIGESAMFVSRLPALANLRQPHPERISATLVTAVARDAAMKFACRGPARKLGLHGDIGYTLAASTGLDLRLHCDPAIDVHIIGADADRQHWTAMPAAVAAAAGKTPLFVAHGLALLPVVDVPHPLAGREIETQWYPFERARDRVAPRHVTLVFEASRGDAVAIHRLKPHFTHWRLLRVHAAGSPAREIHATYNSATFVASARIVDERVRWDVEFETDVPDWVDVHVF